MYDKSALTVGDGPMVTEAYRDPQAAVSGQIVRKWLEPKMDSILASGFGTRMTGLTDIVRFFVFINPLIQLFLIVIMAKKLFTASCPHCDQTMTSDHLTTSIGAIPHAKDCLYLKRLIVTEMKVVTTEAADE